MKKYLVLFFTISFSFIFGENVSEKDTRELELLCNDAAPWISTLKDFFTTRYSRKHELLKNISYNEYF